MPCLTRDEQSAFRQVCEQIVSKSTRVNAQAKVNGNSAIQSIPGSHFGKYVTGSFLPFIGCHFQDIFEVTAVHVLENQTYLSAKVEIYTFVSVKSLCACNRRRTYCPLPTTGLGSVESNLYTRNKGTALDYPYVLILFTFAIIMHTK